MSFKAINLIVISDNDWQRLVLSTFARDLAAHPSAQPLLMSKALQDRAASHSISMILCQNTTFWPMQMKLPIQGHVHAIMAVP